MTEPNGDLSPREREALAQLPREAAPPAALEDSIVGALRARGLLRRPVRRRALEVGFALAASVLVFLGGFALGRRAAPEASAAPAGPAQFALLLYEGPDYRHAPPGKAEERVREYSEWAGARAARGELLAGEKLRDDPDLVIKADGRVTTVTTVPAAPGSTRLAGFFIIRAADRGSALEIARTCPHVRYGGSIVLREIEPT